MVPIPRRARFSPVLFAVLAAGCAAADSKSADSAVATTTAGAPADASVRANTVNFTARDFAFEGPDSIPAGLTAMFGRMVGSRRQGRALYSAMFVLFSIGVAVVYAADERT